MSGIFGSAFPPRSANWFNAIRSWAASVHAEQNYSRTLSYAVGKDSCNAPLAELPHLQARSVLHALRRTSQDAFGATENRPGLRKQAALPAQDLQAFSNCRHASAACIWRTPGVQHLQGKLNFASTPCFGRGSTSWQRPRLYGSTHDLVSMKRSALFLAHIGWRGVPLTAFPLRQKEILAPLAQAHRGQMHRNGWLSGWEGAQPGCIAWSCLEALPALPAQAYP